MGIRNMQGTSAYLEYIGPRGRKRKSDCVFYEEGVCKYSKIQTYLGKCVGRIMCNYFSESDNDLLEEKNHREDVMKVNIKESSRHQLEGKVFRVIHLESAGRIYEFQFGKVTNKGANTRVYSTNSNIAKKFLNKKSGDIIKISKEERYRILGIKDC